MADWMPSAARRVLAAAVLVLAGVAPALAAAATESYPARPIRIVVAFAPGSAIDTVARMVARRLTESLGQPAIVENRAGATGNIGADVVARSAPDGYTLLVTANSIAINRVLAPADALDPLTAFAPVTKLVTIPIVIAASPKLPARTLPELIALARREPGTIAYATRGIASTPHLAAIMFCKRAGIDLLHVPYNASGSILTDVISGEVPLVLSSEATPRIRNGQLVGLAVMSRHRIPALPDVPTVIESGFPDFEIGSWFGLFAPAGTPSAILDTVQGEVARFLQLPATRTKLGEMGLVPVGDTRSQFAADIAADLVRWRSVVGEAGLRDAR